MLSHAHVDHIYGAASLGDLWLHKGDEKLLREGTTFQKGVKPCPKLHFLSDGDKIDLGSRDLRVIHIAGHTDGSILLYDEAEKLLFSGDTVTRRLLYGLHTPVPIGVFCDDILKLNELSINGIYSAHDRAMLPKEHIDYMAKMLSERVPAESKTKGLPFFKFRTFRDGTENDIRYFDFAQLIKRKR